MSLPQVLVTDSFTDAAKSPLQCSCPIAALNFSLPFKHEVDASVSENYRMVRGCVPSCVLPLSKILI